MDEASTRQSRDIWDNTQKITAERIDIIFKIQFEENGACEGRLMMMSVARPPDFPPVALCGIDEISIVTEATNEGPAHEEGTSIPGCRVPGMSYTRPPSHHKLVLHRKNPYLHCERHSSHSMEDSFVDLKTVIGHVQYELVPHSALSQGNLPLDCHSRRKAERVRTRLPNSCWQPQILSQQAQYSELSVRSQAQRQSKSSPRTDHLCRVAVLEPMYSTPQGSTPCQGLARTCRDPFQRVLFLEN